MYLGIIEDDRPRVTIANVIPQKACYDTFIVLGVKKQNWIMRKLFNKQKEHILLCTLNTVTRKAKYLHKTLQHEYGKKYGKISILYVNADGLIYPHEDVNYDDFKVEVER